MYKVSPKIKAMAEIIGFYSVCEQELKVQQNAIYKVQYINFNAPGSLFGRFLCTATRRPN
jgi:hypothetical protein